MTAGSVADGVPRLILIASVAKECEPVRRRLLHMRDCTVGRKPAAEGILAGAPVLLLEGGMGKTNAAQALTAALETRSAAGVIGFGVGGGYAGSGLRPGDLALATSESYGDEGVAAPAGWLSTREIGIPLLRCASGDHYNEMPVPKERVFMAATALMEGGLTHREGRFVTVSTCSGTERGGAALATRFNAIVETMEGAAYAQVAAQYDVPFVQVRGISNVVEDRDLARWHLEEAADVAARAVEQIVASW